MRKLHVLGIVFGLSPVALVLALSIVSETPVLAAPSDRPHLDPGDCTVTTTADSGAGSLRDCMAQLGAGDTITFSTSVFPIANPPTIALVSPLPVMTIDNVTIDGSSAGVILEGSATPAGTTGLVIDGASGVVIKGLQILKFPENGIELRNGASYNTIGGTNSSPGGACTGECNLISGNNEEGVELEGSGTSHNTVSGNYIGTDVSGTLDLGNGDDGVDLQDGSAYNVIGGDTPGERNLISGNDNNGVEIEGSGATNNIVSGNYIGTDVDGTSALGNAFDGVDILHGAGYNTIGGTNGSPGGACTGECNLISGNNEEGVELEGSGTSHNTVSGNYIGTDVSGTLDLGNGDHGVDLEDGSAYNVIGGDTPGERNLISGNDNDGVEIEGSGATNNIASGNYIGTDADGMSALGNAFSGVDIWRDANQNTVGVRNIIAFNGEHGVRIDGNSTLGNRITQNSIHSNGGKGIRLKDGGNAELPSPNITGHDLAGGTATGTACANCTIEIFSDDEDEGRVYEGTTIAGAEGEWNFSSGSPMAGPHITATAADAGGNTSEFRPHTVFLPIILRQYASG